MKTVSSKHRRKVAFRLGGLNKVTGRRIKVAFFTPEDDEAKADPRPKIRKSAQECWNLISTNEDARRTLQKLVDAGCDWVQVLWCVNGFCEHYELPGEMWNAAFVKTLRQVSKRITKFEQKIARWEAAIREFNEEISDLTHVDLAPHAPDFEAYRAVLSLAQKAALPSGRKQNANEENAAYLYHLLNQSTGRAHYEEIADLIVERLKHKDAAETPYQSLRKFRMFRRTDSRPSRTKKDVSAVELQNMVQRFKKRNPQRFLSLLKGVKVGQKYTPPAWYRMPAVVKTKN